MAYRANKDKKASKEIKVKVAACKIGFLLVLISYRKLNHHQLKAGGLTIGGLNRRLEEKAAGSRWFAPRAERPSGGLKPPTDNQSVAP
jgi:hypothetical protein